MAAHAMRFPRRRRWPQRLAGLLGTAALLGSGAAIAVMVMPEKEQAAVPAPAAGAAIKDSSKTKAALTARQKRARRTAVARLADEGYEPVRLADWRPGAALKVLVGRAETGAMRAFFFAGGEFIGYDDPATSTNLRVARTSRDAVTLAYRVSTGGTEKVRFVWRDGSLEPTATVPLASIR